MTEEDYLRALKLKPTRVNRATARLAVAWANALYYGDVDWTFRFCAAMESFEKFGNPKRIYLLDEWATNDPPKKEFS